jgi:chromosome segregation protein
MAKRGHSEEAILRVLREAESGETVVEICRKHGISQQTFYLWKKKYAGLGLSELREQIERESARLSGTERAAESARQIENAAKTVANQILTEQFDTVMPLLKELYRRLRPHADWTEIESNFGGKVRGSLNFVVGDGYNPQFLFSSGQRRAAGLAFLLAVHLSRPWCKWRTLLLDDPVQHIDDYRALNLVEVLAAIRRTNRQVIVAVEDPALAHLLCRRLRSAAGDTGRIFELHTSKTGAAEIVSTRDIYAMPKVVLRSA